MRAFAYEVISRDDSYSLIRARTVLMQTDLRTRTMTQDTMVASPVTMSQNKMACWKPVRVLRLSVLRPVTVCAEKQRNRESVYDTSVCERAA